MSKRTRKELEKSLQFAWNEQEKQETIIELTIKTKKQWESTKSKQTKKMEKQLPSG